MLIGRVSRLCGIFMRVSNLKTGSSQGPRRAVQNPHQVSKFGKLWPRRQGGLGNSAKLDLNLGIRSGSWDLGKGPLGTKDRTRVRGGPQGLLGACDVSFGA